MSDPDFEPTDVEPTDDDSGITPQTRRAIIYSLGVVALAAIIAEVVIVLVGDTASEALLTVAATAVGGLAGIALPGRD